MPATIFTEGELAYFESQQLGRLATAQANGALQANPVAFYYNAALEAVDIGGRDMAATQKFRNVRDTARVAFVVDDVASVQPWRVRCLEVRGLGEAIVEPVDSAARAPGAIIRIHPRRIISWGIDPPHLARGKRNVR